MKSSRGFTLIELMISMALFGLIAAGAMALVMAGTRSQAHSARVDVAQSSLRAGIDFITRDAMMLSAGASTGIITVGGVATPAVNFTTNNNLNINGTTSTDRLDMYLVDGSVASEIIGGVATGATTLPVTYESTTTAATVFSVASHPFVQVSDLKNAVVVGLTAVTNTGTTSATLTVGALPTVNFATNSVYVLPSRHVIYQVASNVFGAANATSNTSMLTMTVNGVGPQPLAEGVEDMQIAYGFDTTGTGVGADIGLAADDDDWLYNKTGDTVKAGMTIDKLRTIRITLVAKSTSTDSGASYNGIPLYEDHIAIPGDGFIRRVLRTEITVRNLNL
jgi:prepilin-type N-terminal cleavage/methylation domain-containing protein